jgi:hypothetical protein
MKDPITGLADARLLDLAADLQVQLEKGTGTRPVLWLLSMQREKATDAIRKLIEIDASETDAIRSLQNEVRLFGDLIESCRSLMERGKTADRKIRESDREALSELVEGLDDDERRFIGVQPGSID